MRITPLDVRKQDFRRSVRGFDCDEVRAFLTTAADEYEAVLVDNKELRERIIEQDEKIAEYSNMEQALRDTLMTAERLMKESKQSAHKEGELIVRDADLKAQRVLDQAQAHAEDIRREILGLKKEKDAFLARVRSLAQAQIHFIDSHGRDFRDLDRQLLGRVQTVADEAVASPSIAEETTDLPSVADEPPPAPYSVADAPLEQASAPAEPAATSPTPSTDQNDEQDDVWRNYIPGNLYASTVAENEDEPHRPAAASVDSEAMGLAPLRTTDEDQPADDEAAALARLQDCDANDDDPADDVNRVGLGGGFQDRFGFGGVASDAALEAVLDAGTECTPPPASETATDKNRANEEYAGDDTVSDKPAEADRPTF